MNSKEDETNYLITGGTGSLGRALTRELIAETDVDRIVVFSRDEWKQAEMIRETKSPKVRYFIGDVRDVERLKQAMQGIDVVIHAAALKRVDAVAYNPGEVVKTNVLGTMNVIEAAVETGVSKVMLVSSDKAVEPMNIYGASKMMAEQYAVYSNSFTYPQDTRVSAVRYGNVLGSRGSVVQIWAEKIKREEIISVNSYCTRFWLTMTQSVRLVLDAVDVMRGGEIFVPKLRGAPVFSLALAMEAPAVSANGDFRPGGEKLHEKLLSTEELFRTHDAGFAWLVAPALAPWGLKVDLPKRGALLEYSSNQVEEYTVEELRGMLVSEGLV